MGKFNCPIINARLTSKFGWRNIGRGKEWHQGVDLCDMTAGKRVPVYASADGVINRVQPLGTYGNVVMIKHIINGKSYETNYAHLSSSCVTIGQKVKQGQKIGVSGNTGGSFGVHLHFEINEGSWVIGQKTAIDPMKWIELTTCIPLESSPKTISKPSPPKHSTDYSKKIGYKIDKNSTAFRIHTDKFKSKACADKAQKDFVKQGYLSYAEAFGNDKDGYRLQSGRYSNQKEAELASKKMLDAKVIGYASIIGTKE